MKKKTTSNFIKLSLLIGCIIIGINNINGQVPADITVEGICAQVNIDNTSVVVGEGAKLKFKFQGTDKFTLINPGGSNLLTLNTPDGINPNGLNRVVWDEFGKQTIGVVPISSTEYYTLSLAGPTSNGTNSIANDASTGKGHSSLKIYEKSGNTGRIQFENETSNSWHQLQSSTKNGIFWLAYYDVDQPGVIDRDFTFDSKKTRFGIGTSNPEFTLDVAHGPIPTGSNIWDSKQGLKLSNTNGGQKWVIHIKGNEFNTGNAATATQGDLMFLSTPTPSGNHARASINYTTGVYNILSDRRLKENINYLDKSNSLEKILKLKPAIYNMKGQNSADKSYGLIAQETQKIIPEIVTSMSTSESNNHIGLSYTELIPIVISSVQKQNEIINELALENDLLKKELLEFRAELAEIKSISRKNLVASNNDE